MHIAPGCGSEDFDLGKTYDLPVLAPVDESGRFYPEYGWLAGLSTSEVADKVINDLQAASPCSSGPVTSRTAIPSAGAATRR